MRPLRFYVPGAAGPEIELDRSESAHAVRVLRVKPGDRIVTFDGNGREFECEVLEARSRVCARVLETRMAAREPARRVVVACAVPKGWRLEFMVEKLAELGAVSFQPVRFERSVARLEKGKIERLRRVAAEASKQCGRSSVMKVESEVALEVLRSAGTVLAAGPDAEIPLVRASAASECTVVIGPEGGFTPEEEGRLGDLGARWVGLGPSILRVETAAIAAMSVLAQL